MTIPFMKMVALSSGKQRAIHGPAVNVPTDLTPVCTLLPRLPPQTRMVPMKLKRKLCYKGHYMFQYIRSAKVLAALRWLKSNNPLYKDIEINTDWLSDAVQDDADLWEVLSAQHCPPSLTPSSSTRSQLHTEQLHLNGKQCAKILYGSSACVTVIFNAIMSRIRDSSFIRIPVNMLRIRLSVNTQLIEVFC